MGRRAAVLSVAVAASALAFSACSNQSALGLAQEACGHVHSSIASYEAGIRAENRAVTERDLTKATIELQAAEPLAAQATSADGQWNALMTTLNEMGQVDEGHLIPALRAQCAIATTNQTQLPNGPGPFPSNSGPSRPKAPVTTEPNTTTTS